MGPVRHNLSLLFSPSLLSLPLSLPSLSLPSSTFCQSSMALVAGLPLCHCCFGCLPSPYVKHGKPAASNRIVVEAAREWLGDCEHRRITSPNLLSRRLVLLSPITLGAGVATAPLLPPPTAPVVVLLPSPAVPSDGVAAARDPSSYRARWLCYSGCAPRLAPKFL